jgi:hypothetical protein
MTLAVPPASGQGLPLDLALSKLAQQYGLKAQALETLSEQADVMERLSHGDQVALLRDTVCHQGRMRADLLEVKALYVRRELGHLYRRAQKYAGPEGLHYRHLNDALLSTRNAVMATRLWPILTQGRAFIAVGALHLPGSGGLLARIAEHGYRIERRY